MKSILYVGATLMIGASIYGFVDYKKTSQKKEFTAMYEEEKKVPLVADDPSPAEPVVSKTIVSSDKKTGSKKHAVSKKEEEVIPVVNPIAEEDRIAVKETKEIEKTSVDVKASKDGGIVKKAKKKKKLDHRIFSRAPLREIEDSELPAPVKKTENKEQ